MPGSRWSSFMACPPSSMLAFLTHQRPSFGSRGVSSLVSPALNSWASLKDLYPAQSTSMGKSAPRCRYCSWGHPSSRCLEKIHAGTRVLPLCCNCGGDHNATSRRCRARPRPVREPQTTSTATGPSRVVFRLDPPPQHNVWTNGPSSWSAFTAQPSAFPPQPGTAAPGQPRVAQPSVPSTLPPVPVPPRDASASALVDGAHQPATAAAAPAPRADLDFEYIYQILIEIKDKVSDIDLRLAALVQDMANPAPVVRSGRDAARG
ncbi:uncharacterized protein LOC123507326 [Portunus trituberculatus]|uniref:uncharacterized protein LOC123507326 n=1 Tax=Portunus trituberculatus TaxID=210409 RepID=UPI001E1CCAC9|nr:uncharacterized protein LOC123507326 [Portunus trituberculatus]